MASPETLAAELLVFDQLAKNLRSGSTAWRRAVTRAKASSMSSNDAVSSQKARNSAWRRVPAGMSLRTGSMTPSSLLWG